MKNMYLLRILRIINFTKKIHFMLPTEIIIILYFEYNTLIIYRNIGKINNKVNLNKIGYKPKTLQYAQMKN